jgi:hypothetical protein
MVATCNHARLDSLHADLALRCSPRRKRHLLRWPRRPSETRGSRRSPGSD